jgi:outer membrane lipoprotein SlyB
MQTRPKLLYPSMVIAAISVTVFSLLGIAALTGNVPYAHSASAAAQTAGGAADGEGGSQAASPVAAAACRDCGTVLSIQQVETRGSGTGVGAVAGGLAGAFLGNGMGRGNGRTAMTLIGGVGGAYAGNEIEKNTHKSLSYQVRVRMEDGRIRQVYQRDPPSVAVGDHVQIAHGVVMEKS